MQQFLSKQNSLSASNHVRASAQETGCAFDFPCNYLQVDSYRLIVRRWKRFCGLWECSAHHIHEKENWTWGVTVFFFLLTGEHKWVEPQLWVFFNERHLVRSRKLPPPPPPPHVGAARGCVGAGQWRSLMQHSWICSDLQTLKETLSIILKKKKPS